MFVICCDLEGVFTPEVWINVAEKTGIPELRKTTRDEPNYDLLMQQRLKILDDHGLTLRDIQAVIRQMPLLEGAAEFVRELKEKYTLIIVSDTFRQFAGSFLEKMDYPTLLCHELIVDSTDRITGYALRQQNAKRTTVQAFHSMNYQVIAFGDSYNDTNMLKEAEAGILFRPPQNVIDEFPQFPVVTDYTQLRNEIEKAIEKL